METDRRHQPEGSTEGFTTDQTLPVPSRTELQNPESPKRRAPKNRTLTLTDGDRARLYPRIISDGFDHTLPDRIQAILSEQSSRSSAITIQGDAVAIAPFLPQSSIDLLILDPPYNLSKDFHGYKFAKHTVDDYTNWLNQAVLAFKPLLKPTASIYICGDWLTSVSIFTVASSHFTVRNRITWEREKGRGARRNWKNSSEDIWFCTVSDHYTFNTEAVKLRRRVVAPYRNHDGTPKDWNITQGGNFRDTHPSNLWTDITIPFWSMPENTDHPTQKSEKLIAKLILASTNPGDLVLDPFSGSGTSSVVAQKLGRRSIGIEQHETYCLLTERRLELAEVLPAIQGFSNGVFWERNTLMLQQRQ
jgi:site-specific DNA-methyltransferase (adenine-specific)